MLETPMKNLDEINCLIVAIERQSQQLPSLGQQSQSEFP
jgi:hypothetical protein